MNKLNELLKIEGREIASAFEKASLEGEGTPQEVADRREEIVKSFLTKYFPYPFRIVKGNIVDSYGRRSNSIDCIILNPSHPYTINPSNDKASIIMADGVDYAIEIKTDLANQTEIERGLNQIRSVKKLRRRRHSLILEKDDEKLDYAKIIPGFIFADKTYVDIRTLISHIVNYYVENEIPPKEQFDIIVINNRALIINYKNKSCLSNETLEGIAFIESAENTLALFLLLMNVIPKSEPEISDNIIKMYLEDTPIGNIKEYTDLNKKLHSINV